MMLRNTLVLLALTFGSTSAFAPSSRAAFTPRTTTALNVAIDTSDIKNGMTIELDGEPYKVLNFSIMKQARGAAKTTIKFKNLMRGSTIENTYRSGEKFQTAMIEKNGAQFTYADENGNHYFMDMETFEEVAVGPKIMEDVEQWMCEGMEVNLVNFKGNVIEVVVPNTYTFEIVETEPSIKGNTAQGHTKPAVLNCGATITVPGYLETGEMIKVDTGKKEFLSRDNE
mmetsp:Transcript_34467/g.51435  ORF Transcript_34467/g.51435 Transcript_34467/m.51435 type:complete len:227 (-) Transcript_34467:188-868(-)